MKHTKPPSKPAETARLSDTVPTAPDPIEVAQKLRDLVTQTQAVMLAAINRAANPEPLAYDPAQPLRAWMAFSGAMLMNPRDLVDNQMRYMQDWTALWRTAFTRAAGEAVEPVIEPERGDRRFHSPAWREDGTFDTLKQSYLLAAKQVRDLIETSDFDPETRKQVEFYANQLLNAASPSNYAWSNPDVARRTLETGGLNLMTGLANLLEDLAAPEGLVRRRASKDFEVGVDIAATPGSVVFQNELFQLIQYNPATDKVAERPVLFVSPLVNKYYLFDLTPRSSFLKWLVDQGQTVFVISWVNPDESLADKDLSDYVQDGVLAALGAVEAAADPKSGVDLVSYCLGGTITSMALAYLAKTGGEKRIASATLIAALLDFRDIGEWSVFIGEEELITFERYLDEKGFVEAHDLAKLFSVVRANDLIWSSVVNHYLMGEESRPSDLLAWFDDGARIPAATLKQYGRQVLQKNALKEPGELKIGDVALDLGAIKAPVYIIALRDDHVSAWKETYRGRFLFGGQTRFILGGSGHNAGTINPPDANKHGYWTNDKAPKNADDWLEKAEQKPGSWWPEWRSWIGGDEQIEARTPGDGKLAVIEPAPGSYVRRR